MLISPPEGVIVIDLVCLAYCLVEKSLWQNRTSFLYVDVLHESPLDQANIYKDFAYSKLINSNPVHIQIILNWSFGLNFCLCGRGYRSVQVKTD